MYIPVFTLGQTCHDPKHQRSRGPQTRTDEARAQPGNCGGGLLAIGRRCAAHLKGKLVDHGDLLYDDIGLPK